MYIYTLYVLVCSKNLINREKVLAKIAGLTDDSRLYTITIRRELQDFDLAGLRLFQQPHRLCSF